METGKKATPLGLSTSGAILEGPQHPSLSGQPFPNCLDGLGFSPLVEYRPDRSVEGPVSPGRTLGQCGSNPPQRFPPSSSYWNRG